MGIFHLCQGMDQVVDQVQIAVATIFAQGFSGVGIDRIVQHGTDPVLGQCGPLFEGVEQYAVESEALGDLIGVVHAPVPALELCFVASDDAFLTEIGSAYGVGGTVCAAIHAQAVVLDGRSLKDGILPVGSFAEGRIGKGRRVSAIDESIVLDHCIFRGVEQIQSPCGFLYAVVGGELELRSTVLAALFGCDQDDPVGRAYAIDGCCSVLEHIHRLDVRWVQCVQSFRIVDNAIDQDQRVIVAKGGKSADANDGLPAG